MAPQTELGWGRPGVDGDTVEVLYEAILGSQSGFGVSKDAALPTLGRNTRFCHKEI